jgi:hypothetical protein
MQARKNGSEATNCATKFPPSGEVRDTKGRSKTHPARELPVAHASRVLASAPAIVDFLNAAPGLKTRLTKVHFGATAKPPPRRPLRKIRPQVRDQFVILSAGECSRPPIFDLEHTGHPKLFETRVMSGTRSNKSPVTCNFA